MNFTWNSWKKLLLILCILTGKASASEDLKKFNQDYAELIYLNYQDALLDAQKMHESIISFLQTPSEANLAKAKQAWLQARIPYGQSEAFRFYQGPIDFFDQKQNLHGPEGRLNAWPIDESYIDYVVAGKKSGLVNDIHFKINKKNLIAKNQKDDEAEVATGYHAIEFLLYGADLSLASPGKRPASDYIPNNLVNRRRGDYLKIVSLILLDDLQFLSDQWNLKNDNGYVKEFLEKDPKENLAKILTALATLSGFEMSSERMATGLDSGDQEDEQSCFSDNTHNDYLYNLWGIKNVYLGSYKTFKATGIYDLLLLRDKILADKILTKILEIEAEIKSLPQPIDREILASKDLSHKAALEKAADDLSELGEMFKEAGKIFGVEVHIISQ